MSNIVSEPLPVKDPKKEPIKAIYSCSIHEPSPLTPIICKCGQIEYTGPFCEHLITPIVNHQGTFYCGKCFTETLGLKAKPNYEQGILIEPEQNRPKPLVKIKFGE